MTLFFNLCVYSGQLQSGYTATSSVVGHENP